MAEERDGRRLVTEAPAADLEALPARDEVAANEPRAPNPGIGAEANHDGFCFHGGRLLARQRARVCDSEDACSEWVGLIADEESGRSSSTSSSFRDRAAFDALGQEMESCVRAANVLLTGDDLYPTEAILTAVLPGWSLRVTRERDDVVRLLDPSGARSRVIARLRAEGEGTALRGDDCLPSPGLPYFGRASLNPSASNLFVAVHVYESGCDCHDAQLMRLPIAISVGRLLAAARSIDGASAH